MVSDMTLICNTDRGGYLRRDRGGIYKEPQQGVIVKREGNPDTES